MTTSARSTAVGDATEPEATEAAIRAGEQLAVAQALERLAHELRVAAGAE